MTTPQEVDLHRAMERLEAALHPRQETIELTEAMRIAPPARAATEWRARMIGEIEAALREALPDIVARAVDRALDDRSRS